ncbi:uncharacterized protein LOC114540642 isoform X2 [Dendronephthya gigantea]|uniref:uncharacterized protein LOC114540642 isoform X2 n=1 Tax=Dendronephthya gigantea TaxID=151771 RepID=UPI00106954E4|nr:uncharacterized protein LOC114540642 isoform X2 [Dendronephthya gigantea]
MMFSRTILLTFMLCSTILIQQSYGLNPLDAFNEIVKIVNSNPPAKGFPFPTIPSPRSVQDKIAIVGGGPAGIHMAYLLKKRGFKDIVVYEKSGRIGGKSLTVEYRNTVHEMGTCYTTPDYEENVIALAKEYGLWDPVDIPSANIWQDHVSNPSQYSNYVILEIMKILNTNNPNVAIAELLKAMVQYCALHRQLFGKYEGDLMRQPGSETMKKLRCTFEEFLKQNNLLVLKPIFIASHTVQGYGHIDEISALYGLMWNTPVYVKELAGKFIGVSHGLNMIRGGFQNLWKTIVERENIKVVTNVNVVKVIRRTNCVYVVRKFRYGWRYYRRGSYFDFLIWTPSVYSTRRRLHTCRKEWNIFSKLKPVWFSTTLFSSTYGTRGESPIDYWLDNVENKREHSLWAQRDSYGTLSNYYGEAYKNGSLPGGPDHRFIRTGVAYQYGKGKPCNNCLTTILRRNLTTTGSSNIQIVRQESWEYFPKFSPNDMANGVLWDIFKMQGSRRTWFAGSSVNFESVKSVLEYNKLLVSKMDTTA